MRAERRPGALASSIPHACQTRSCCRCAAVLFVNGQVHYTDGQPSAALLSKLQSRDDNQIMSLEACRAGINWMSRRGHLTLHARQVMAISVGLSTFADLLHDRKVVVFSDNTGAEASRAVALALSGIVRCGCVFEAAARKGSARSWDHCAMIHEIWSLVRTF